MGIFCSLVSLPQWPGARSCCYLFEVAHTRGERDRINPETAPSFSLFHLEPVLLHNLCQLQPLRLAPQTLRGLEYILAGPSRACPPLAGHARSALCAQIPSVGSACPEVILGFWHPGEGLGTWIELVEW